MTGADHYARWLPEPTTLLGLRLRPFALGHALLLHRIESAFVLGGRPSFEDLALSVLICAHDWSGACALFEDRDLPRFMRRWAERLCSISWLTRIGLRAPRPLDLAAKCEEFAAYTVRDLPSYTYVLDPERDAGPVGLPTLQVIRVALLKELHFPEDQLLNRPLALCYEDLFTLRALDRSMQMVAEEDLTAALQAADAAFAKLNPGMRN